MIRTEYEKEKQEILDNANKRAEEIIKKYNPYTPRRDLEGRLCEAPWAKELREDSKKTMEELKKLDKKYNK